MLYRQNNLQAFILFLILWVCVGSKILAQSIDPIEIKHKDDWFSIGTHVSTFLDDSRALNVEDIIQDEYLTAFQKSNREIVNKGVTKSTLWTQFAVQNHLHESCFLEITNFALDSIELYELTEDGYTHLASSGSYKQFEDFEIKYNSFIFELTSNDGNLKNYVIKVSHTRGTQFAVNVSTLKGLAQKKHKYDFVHGLYFGFMLLVILYNLFLYFSIKDISYVYYVLYAGFMTLLNASLTGYGFEHLWPSLPEINKYQDFMGVLLCVSGVVFATNFLETKKYVPVLHNIFLGFIGVFVISTFVIFSGNFMMGTILVESASFLLIIFFFVVAFRMLQSGYKQARFFLYAWSVLLLGVALFILKDFDIIPYNVFTVYSLQIGSAAEALLLSFALADRINVYKKEKEQAQQNMLESLRENEKLIINQNQLLEMKVNERTALLNKSLTELKDTQSQLIHAEKMASLGELTAGIAHEIQNPLNFVNNFSELGIELINDMNEQIDSRDYEEVKNIARDISDSLDKINHHGKRADGIVKAMLLHSRTGKSQKESCDINQICDEYLKLAYHGFRAKDKSFNSNMETDFDTDIPLVEIVAQDFGRAILNIINNAFYAVQLRKQSNEKDYKACVKVRTEYLDSKTYIRISDNGSGIQDSLKEKIFQPFFTTKPTGKGTGLGLSLTYDIILAHGGTIDLESKEGVGTTFTICI
jgi:two-component system, NtrC family, sensor kinase